MKQRTSSSSNIFDAVSALEAQDVDDPTLPRRTHRDVERGRAAQAQSQIYQSGVECRILWQRSVQAMAQSSGSPDTALEQCHELLVQLLRARQMLSPSPEEIDYAALDEDRLHEQLQLEYEQHREVWKEVLDRRQKEVRLHSGALTTKHQFRVLDASFWQQVEATVQHEQMRNPPPTAAVQAPNTSMPYTVFDDSKVYQQLLKDLVDTLPTNQAPAARERRKAKKAVTVDRKASKGRRLRYTEVSKLRHFTFPVPRRSEAVGLDEDAWFRSLLGGGTTRAADRE